MNRSGFTLAELVISLALALFLIAGALQLLARGRASQRTAQSIARLEEQARAALEVLAADLRAAGYWGLAAGPVLIEGSTAAGTPEPTGLAVAGGCIASLAHDLAHPLAAANARYALDAALGLECAPNSIAVPGADTLTVRHAASGTTRATVGRLQIESTTAAARLLADGQIRWSPGSSVHDLEVSTFYVATQSTGRATLPSLRRKRLVGGTRPAFQDEELVAGIGDLQVELGVDAPADGDQAVDGWYLPGSAPPAGTIRAVRVHVLAVAETPEAAVMTEPALAYSDRRWAPRQTATRRLVAAQTVQLRNAGMADR
jgi:type IV pilus assembly protein PilW